MYPTITATAIAAAEADQVRRRAFSMAVTVDGSDGSDGHPTSYSAAFDALAFGTDIARSDDGIELLGQPDPHAARLFVLSAGNVPADQWTTDHLALSDVAPVQNPAQAWNALTVGAYTEKVTPPTAELFRGWATVATTGELSPFSRTSMTFGRGWPIKPDIVLEGGNLLVDPSGAQFDQHDDVSLLTTRNASFRLLTTANATSAATAQAARLAAIAMEQYPSLWPETVRGLLVHAAEWTPAMQAHFRVAGTKKGERVQLLRRYGWGVPTEERVLSSAASSVTLILQDEFQPLEPGKSGGLTMRALRLHKLPWPQEQLRDLFSAGVRLRVTLSYFVEPNPSSRGWEGRYKYASHGLRFDVKRPTETIDDFRVGSATRRRGKRAAMRRSGRLAPTTAGTWAADCATPAPCTQTSGPAPAPNSPTAATSASSRSAAGGRTTTARTGPASRSATPCSCRCTPTRWRPTSTPRSPPKSAFPSRYRSNVIVGQRQPNMTSCIAAGEVEPPLR